MIVFVVFFFKQKTAYEMRISDWSSDVCSSDLVGLWAGGRFPVRDIPLYIVAQVLGAIAAAVAIYVIASGAPGYSLDTHGLAANGFGAHSPGGYAMGAGFLAEVLLTSFFLLIIIGSTDPRAPAGFPPVSIRLDLTFIPLLSIPLTPPSVNTRWATCPALVQGGWAGGQLWFFWVAPLIGGVLGGVSYRVLGADRAIKPPVTGEGI